MKKNYFIKLSFDGTAYNGWQIQKNAPKTIQATLNQALSLSLREEVFLSGCGRTDTGVHAREFYADFRLEGEQLEKSKAPWVLKFNQLLPKDISIHEIFEVPINASARRLAVKRTYEYHICFNKDPFLLNRAFRVYGNLDLPAMKKGAALLKKHSDFAAFCKARGGQNTTICKIYQANWKSFDDRLVFTITADRFLRNMVRAIVGTLVDIGMGRRVPQDIDRIIAGKKRTEAGRSVPACGLYLTHVEYPKSLVV